MGSTKTKLSDVFLTVGEACCAYRHPVSLYVVFINGNGTETLSNLSPMPRQKIMTERKAFNLCFSEIYV